MLPPSWKSEVQKAVDEKIDADRGQRQAQQNDASTKIAAAIKALSDAQNTQTEHDDRNEKTNVKLAILTIFLVFLTVVFTGASWWVFSGQLTEMKSAGEQTKQLIETNAKLVEAATKQAEAATENAKISRDSYIASQRAWVGPRNARIDAAPVVGKDLTIFVDYGNSGREPAIEMVYDTDPFTATEEENTNGKVTAHVNSFTAKCKVMWKPGEAGVVYPSAGLSTGYALTRVLDNSLIDDDVISGAKYIVIDGCFSYKTAETIHRSWFCYFYKAGRTPIGTWHICQTGNGAD
jgi:hypothetical protein